MKKIAIKVIIFIAIVYTIWYTYINLFAPYYNDRNHTRWLYLKNKVSKNNQYNIVLVGESRLNAGVDVCQLHNATSLAAGGATAIEMYYLLYKYLQHSQTPQIVVLSVSPRFMTETYSFWQHAVRNDFFSLSDMQEIAATGNSLLDTFPDNFFWLRYAAYKARWIPYYQDDVRKHLLFRAKSKNNLFDSEMHSWCGRHFHPNLAPYSSAPNRETFYNAFTPSVILTHYLHRIIALCKQRQINLFFVAMPINQTSHRLSNQVFISEYKAFMKQLSVQYPQQHFDTTFPVYPNYCFGDESHLNVNGMKRYTNELIQKISAFGF